MSDDRVTTIVAGPEWLPLAPALDIEPGSALDFSTLGLQDAPAGKHGRVIARSDGQFAFEKRPDQPCRFYGVNLCSSAQFLAHDEADRLAERLARLGYNAVRVHHHERELVADQPDSTTLNPLKLDQLDYFLAACARRGIYISTDLFVSRPVPYRECGIDRPGTIPTDLYKVMVGVVPGAWENWKAFAKALLTHVNPYTRLRYGDDPALAWLGMINEGAFSALLDRAQEVPEWSRAWNAWLARRYPSRDQLVGAWGQELKESEDPAKGSVAWPAEISRIKEMDSFVSIVNPRQRDCLVFFAQMDREMVGRMTAFLRDECGCRALVTNAAGSWTPFACGQTARMVYDYVDDHFYVDHPQFLETPWRLPSRCDNRSPIAGGAGGGLFCAFTRLFDKPFTISEYNYSGPGRCRGVGGILTGALGALQGWAGIWRFAYSHDRGNLFAPRPMGFFDMVTDPLSQAAERASLCLFLRGDLRAAPHAVAIAMTAREANGARPMPGLAPSWRWLAWVTRVGTLVAEDAAALAPATVVLPLGAASRTLAGNQAVGAVKPYDAGTAEILGLLEERKIIAADDPTDPDQLVFRSETGEIGIDARRDALILDTPKTAGGYAPAGQTVACGNDRLRIEIEDADATLWLSALDGQPLETSRRILVTHLTDLQNTEIRYAEPARQTLLDWGRLPHLVRVGKARIALRHAQADQLKVWALASSGRRLAEVPAATVDGSLRFTADVAGAAFGGARMLYEIAIAAPSAGGPGTTR